MRLNQFARRIQLDEAAKEKAAWRKALSKSMHSHFKHIPDYDDVAEFYPDKETDNTYEWHFKLNDNEYELCCNKRTKSVTLVGK